MLMKADLFGVNLKMIQKHLRMPRVLGSNQINCRQRLDGSKRHIVKIADRRWHQIESSRFIISKAANLLHKYHPYFCG